MDGALPDFNEIKDYFYKLEHGLYVEDNEENEKHCVDILEEDTNDLMTKAYSIEFERINPQEVLAYDFYKITKNTLRLDEYVFSHKNQINKSEALIIVKKITDILLKYHNSLSLRNLDEKSIFVIDEASMIDIEIFKFLLEAIPTGAKVFILGDEHQLPSVQAGAILGELLKEKKDSVAELKESMRFNSNSEVGLLSEALQSNDSIPQSMVDFKNCSDWLSQSESFSRIKNGKRTTQDSNPVLNIMLSPENKGDQIKRFIKKWADEFFTSKERDLTELASNLNRKNVSNRQLADLWTASNEAKILCAERQGLVGVEELNGLMSRYVNSRYKQGDYFAGQLLMITRNQSMFSLYNGDCGILVGFNDSNIIYFMVEKKIFGTSQESAESSSEEIFRIGDFLFYPVYLFPKDSVETAYAITIHKSQGSGYKNIMVFLPEKEGHPLLNRQILYTAITRTKGTTCIVSTRELMEYAKNTVIKRDTKILLSEDGA